jgi:hypothetical protein
MRNFYFRMKVKTLFPLSILATRCSSYNSRSRMYIIVRTSARNSQPTVLIVLVKYIVIFTSKLK